MTVPNVLLFFPTTWLCHQQLKIRLPWSMVFKALLSCAIMASVAWIALIVRINFLIVALVIAPIIYFTSLSILSAWTPLEVETFHKTTAKISTIFGQGRAS
jgi:hypothetical protein